MPYRTAEIKPEPKFSYVERLFISTKKRHRALGHAVLIWQRYVVWFKSIVIAVGIVAAAFIAVGVVFGICTGIQWVYLNHLGMLYGSLVSITVVSLIALFNSGYYRFQKFLQKNNADMDRVIKHKRTGQIE